MDEKKVIKNKAQNIIIENREKLSVSGVIDLESFNEDSIYMETELGPLVIKGEGLRINKLNLDNSELIIEGEIISCEYTDDEGGRSKGIGLLGRMFR